jgi:hypothetical protein
VITDLFTVVYNGVATPHELVICRREPTNQYDNNAIRVNNVMGSQIGHLPRTVVSKLAPYIDSEEITIEGVLMGEKGSFDCPIRLYLYGTSDRAARLVLEEKLKNDKLLKVTQMKATRKEAEARKSTGLKSGTTGAGLGKSTTLVDTAQRAEQEVSLQNLVEASEVLETQRTGNFADALAAGEEALEAMPVAEQPEMLKSQLLPYQLQVNHLPRYTLVLLLTMCIGSGMDDYQGNPTASSCQLARCSSALEAPRPCSIHKSGVELLNLITANPILGRYLGGRYGPGQDSSGYQSHPGSRTAEWTYLDCGTCQRHEQLGAADQIPCQEAARPSSTRLSFLQADVSLRIPQL